MVYNASADLWYQYFKEDGSGWVLVMLYGIRLIWATVGFMFNLALVYITAKSRNLHGLCNLLLAMESGLALLQDASYYLSFGIVLSGIRFVRYEYCFWALIPCCLCGDAAQMTMVFTSLDRLCCVIFPFWYKQRKAKGFLLMISMLLCCYMLYVFVINFMDYQGSKNFMVSCSTHDMGFGGYGWLMKVNGLTLSGTLMAIYLVICWFMAFQLDTTSKTVNEHNRKLLKALVFIIGLNLLGVFLKSIVNMLFQHFLVVNVFARTASTIAFSFLTIAVYSANGPVLYAVNSEYRNRFNQHLPWLPKFLQIFGKKYNLSVTNNMVMPIPSGVKFEVR